MVLIDGRGKWRKRKREAQINNRRPKQEEEDEDEDDAVVVADDDLEQQQHQEDDSEGGVHPNPQSGATADLGPQESEVLPEGGVRYCEFPLVVRHALIRPHSSVMGIVALERANELGESKAQGQGSPVMFLENVSYGQLQALSAAPADSPSLDQDRSDGGNSAYVVTPPPIMEGRGVVKRFWNRCHVIPLHSG